MIDVTINVRDVGDWVMEQSGSYFDPEHMTAIGNLDDGKVLGGAVYSNYTGVNGSVLVNVAGKGNWMTRDLIYTAFAYPFNQLKVRKLMAMVASSNRKSLKFNTKMGFVPEAVIPEAMPDGDMFIMSMTRDQCRWLDDKFRPKWMEVTN